MDLNEIPSDHMSIDAKMEEKDNNLGNVDEICDGGFRVNVSEVEKRCVEVEEKRLGLRFRNKCKELEEIRGKIRVLEGERVRIEEEVEGLRKEEETVACGVRLEDDDVGWESGVVGKMRVLYGEMVKIKEEVEGGVEETEIMEAVSCRLGLEGGNVGRESGDVEGTIRVLDGERVTIEEGGRGLRRKEDGSVEETEVIKAVVRGVRLEGENVGRGSDDVEGRIRVLESERNAAIREVEEWKRRCKEFELRVQELEERLRCRGKDGEVNGVEDDVKGVNVVGGSSNVGSGTCSHGGIQIKGTFSTEKPVKRQRELCNQRSSDQKVAPATPGEERPSVSVAVIDTDSDHEHDVSADHGQCSPSETLGVSASAMIGTTIEEDEIFGEGSDTLVKTPKRKRDLTVVTSDDEPEESEDEVVPKRRAFKIDNSDNEGEEEDDDDALPIKRIFNGVKSNHKSDDEDNIPISQLKMNRARGSRRSARLQKKNTSGRISANRPRRRLVKRGQSPQTDGTKKMKISSDNLTKKYVDDDDSEGYDSKSDSSLSDFIVSDNGEEESEDVKELEDELPEDDSHHSHENKDSSDDNVDFEDIISRLHRRKDPNSEWALQGDMLSEFAKNPELCMRAVCSLYRRQTAKQMLWMEDIYHVGRGFSKFDARRGTMLGEFLTDGNPSGGLVKTVEEVQAFNCEGLKICRSLAVRYSNQLFEIYNDNEDPFFP
ncbi:hypothetical protein vseg_001306 [Gypsophila vaccaria]